MPKTKLSEKHTQTPRFLPIEPYLRPEDRPIASDQAARKPRLVPLVVMDYGSLSARVRQMRYIGREMFGSLREMAKSARSIRENPHTGKQTIDARTLAELEAYARELGAAEIGYTQVDRRYIFNGYRILYPNAMVLTIEMDRDKIKQAPAITAFIEIFRTYYLLGVIVNQIADFFRARGYNAHAGPAIGGDVNYIPLAIDAGLGYPGKNGLLITRQHGPRIRLASVYTDIANLPFAGENQHAWVREFCAECNLCIEKCPADAIYPDPVTLPDGGPAFIDHTRCALPFSNDNGCTLCIKHCPFSYGDYGKLKARFLGVGDLTGG